jgi:hypothetical protein
MAPMLSTAKRARYRVTYSPLAGSFKIIDENMDGAYCALPDKTGHLVQLSFRTADKAHAWLRYCGEEQP